MIGLRFDAKKFFFDRQRVLDATTRAVRKVLSRFGAFVRTRARTSMRRRKGTAPPGSPPFAHSGLIRDNIYFVYEPTSQSVVIGPVKLNGPVSDTALEALEHGGPSETAFFRGGKREQRTVQIRPHPFMQPALDAELAAGKLDNLWAGSIK